MSNLKVAVIQSDIEWNNKIQNQINFANKISQLPNDIDLIVLPEMFNTGFIMDMKNSASSADEIIEWLYQQIKHINAAIICSAATFAESGEVANRLYFVTSDKVIHTYDKNHLFIHAGEDKKYIKGHERKIVEYKGFRFLLTICFDLRFPVFNCNNHDYDILINVASWPASRAEHWNALLKARAIENQAYVIACNRVGQDANLLDYSGDSTIIDFNGIILKYQKDKETVLFAELNKELQNSHRNKFNFLLSQDNFTLNLL